MQTPQTTQQKNTEFNPVFQQGNEQARQYSLIRSVSLQICRPLKIEDMVVQPSAHISPPKWHIAHTSWFFEEIILRSYLKKKDLFHPKYSTLFNSYYKSLGPHWQQSERGYLSRPTVDEIIEYRHWVDSHMLEFLSHYDGCDQDFNRLLEVGLQHEQQHQELLLMDIKFILGMNPVAAPYSLEPLSSPTYPSQRWNEFEEGLYEVGCSGNDFHFDNEGPRHKTYLYSFAISSKYVTNQEYLEFIEAGGYDRPELWLSMGWDWVQQKNIQSPLYWRKLDGAWWEWTLHGQFLLRPDLPVCHLSYFEAEAYARWRGLRLPLEQESEVFLEQKVNHSMSGCVDQVGLHPKSASAPGGELWWWTGSAYRPYPGYKAFPGPLSEYNGKFMCNQIVLKGGCVATPGRHHRSSYRNFYLPDQRWMFSGLRLAKDL